MQLFKTEIAVVGSGFSGALMAMILAKLGRRVLLLERGRHPRFAIGESSTPLTDLLWETLCDRYGLSEPKTLSKWGSWQQSHPELVCGLKRGFSFFHHQFGAAFENHIRHNQLLVAASPHDRIADTHWFRSDFDAFLVAEAQRAGVCYLDEIGISAANFDGPSVTLHGKRNADDICVHAEFLIDATGPRGFASRHLGAAEMALPHLPPTVAAFSHFRNVSRWADLDGEATPGLRRRWAADSGSSSDHQANGPPPPYPVDDAALHHIFDGGWIWVLRFNNGITSAGAAVTARLNQDLNLEQGAAGWERLLNRLPAVKKQFAHATAVEPFRFLPQLSYMTREVAGANWALLPYAAGFIDPLLSTGFPLTLLGIEQLARAFEDHWRKREFGCALRSYASSTRRNLLLAEQLVAALYANMRDFELFTALSLLYFAAASFTETCWRLGRREAAGDQFLLGSYPIVGSRIADCCQQAIRYGAGDRAISKSELIHLIYDAIQPVDIGGFSDRTRRNWFDVRADDLMLAAGKLGVSQQEIHAMLECSGFF